MLNRRTFMQHTARRGSGLVFVGLGAGLLPRPGYAQKNTAPTDRLRIGVIGLGSRGFNLIDGFLAEPDCEIVVVCDVDRFHYRDRPWGTGPAFGREPARARIQKAMAKQQKSGQHSGPETVADFREVCGREDLDAVVIATPDHWHALCTQEALQQGLDVYCEKPVTHLFAEGQQISQLVKQKQAVFQTGSQQRSEANFQRAVNLVRNHHLGTIQEFQVGLPPGYENAQDSTKIETPRADLDYDFWCGPAEKLPYMRARHHRWWRAHSAFGGGVLMDWIGHHNDIAHWAIGAENSGPTRVEAVHWEPARTDVYDTPFHYEIRTEYAGGIRGAISDQNPLGTRIIGTEGWLFVTRGKLEASNKEWLRPDFVTGEKDVPASPGHIRNFLDCIRSRKECIAPAAQAHRSITPGHLGYISHKLNTPLQWDPQNEQIIDNPEADKLLKQVHYRDKWTN